MAEQESKNQMKEGREKKQKVKGDLQKQIRDTRERRGAKVEKERER